MEAIAFIVGILLMALVQLQKRYLPGLHPHVVVAALAVLSGAFYAIAIQTGTWEQISSFGAIAGTGAIAVYSFLKEWFPTLIGEPKKETPPALLV